jgi:hypothetical protein
MSRPLSPRVRAHYGLNCPVVIAAQEGAQQGRIGMLAGRGVDFEATDVADDASKVHARHGCPRGKNRS